MGIFKVIYINILLLAVFILSFIGGVLSAAILSLFARDKRKVFHDISKVWATVLLRTAGVKVTVTGLEKLNLDGPKVVIANHQGNFDIPILLSVLPLHARFLAKKELFSIPLMSWYMRSRGDIRIDRRGGKSAAQLMNDVTKAVKEGDTVLIFPEGTRSRDGSVGAFKRGSVVLAMGSGAKIVPVAISGSYNIQPRGSLFINPCDVKVTVGAPVTVSYDMEDYEQSIRISEELRANIVSLMGK